MTDGTSTDHGGEQPTGYADAVRELEDILGEIEGDDVDVDLLAERVARATVLIEFCRARILRAETALGPADPAEDG